NDLVLLIGHKADNANYQALLLKDCWCGTCFKDLGKRSSFSGIRWSTKKIRVTPAVLAYFAGFPSPNISAEMRLEYFGNFLEADDSAIAADAFLEFSNAEQDGIQWPVGLLRSESLRKWLTDPKLPVVRQAIYALMLGLSGSDADASFLQRKITEL